MLNYITDIKKLLFPPLCISCEINEIGVYGCFCRDCEEKLPLILSSAQSKNALVGKDFFPAEVQQVMSLFYFSKESRVAKLVHHFKYEGRYKIAEQLGYALGLGYQESWEEDMVIVPVPVHPKRKRTRGYNQAEKIAVGLSKATGLPMSPSALIRDKYESSQINKSMSERASVLNSSFVLGDVDLSDKVVVLVDDVITTGSTINACYQALSGAHPRRVIAASVGISV